MKSESGTYASLKRFSAVALAEGVSFILLMFVAMPLKYLADMPAAVKYTGWAHGILFIAYFIFLTEAKLTAKWNLKKTALAALASLLPLGRLYWIKKSLNRRWKH